ncbi:hypothetical protein AALA00_08745 [Lachnospiraceae bacterium 46-15]
MKKFRKYVVYLMLGMSVAALLAGCKKKAKETESELAAVQITETVTEKDTEVEEKTGTAVSQTETYTSKDRSVSINLPDDTWKNTKDKDGTLAFEAPEGSITVSHISGSEVASVKLPATKEEVLDNLTASGKNADNYEVTEFRKSSAGTMDQYRTTIKCSDTEEDYSYSVGYDIVTTTDIYSVTGLIKSEDEEVLEAVKTAVESFKVLKKSSKTKKDTTSTGQTGSGQGSTTQTGTSMVIYDSNGNPITVTKNASGVWSDSSGKTYEMQEYGVMGSDGYWYTYASSSSGNNTDNSNDNNNGNNDNSGTNNDGNNGASGTTPQPSTGTDSSGFYDQSGNYIPVTKDKNGNWVDAYGTVYYFGDDGVTDNAGNYYPYKDSSEATGFYDDKGNYITVTKDSNGNWVDSSGAKYTFGDDGVTDAAGNFYPY